MLKKLINQNKILFDVEFGNQNGYFSDSKSRSQSEDFDFSKSFSRYYNANIQGARGNIFDSIIHVNGGVLRDVSFQISEAAYLYDFVSRFVVISDNRKAEISSCSIEHKNSNIYYQFPALDFVRVPIGDSHWLKFADCGSSKEDMFDNVFYVRDESQVAGEYKWIVHHRKIVKEEYADFIIRSCNPRFEGVIPFQSLIPKKIKQALFRIREKKYPNFPLMSVGVANAEGLRLNLRTKVSIIENEK